MGNKLIIKNADFSANGIKEPDSILESFPLIIGKAWAGDGRSSPRAVSDNDKRASQDAYVSINGAAYGTISLKAKSGYKFAVYFGTASSYDGGNVNLVTWEYTDSGSTLTVDISTALYGIIMVANNENTTLTSNDINVYIDDVTDYQ